MEYDAQYEALVFSSGRKLQCFEGIIGMFLDGTLELTAGHDCYPMLLKQDGNDAHPNVMTRLERKELSEHMIELWRKWGEL